MTHQGYNITLVSQPPAKKKNKQTNKQLMVFKLRNFLPNIWPVLFKSVDILKDRLGLPWWSTG